MNDLQPGAGRPAPEEPDTSWLPPLRGWDEAEGLTDWPSGFCHGESDYRTRVIEALKAKADARTGSPAPHKEDEMSEYTCVNGHDHDDVWAAEMCNDIARAARTGMTGAQVVADGKQVAEDAPAIDRIVQRVAELPDRTSPDNWPEAMLVTADELRSIAQEELGSPAPASQEEAALLKMFEAWQELRRLGWQEIMYCPKDGTRFWSIEPGSTGIHDTHYSGEWPKGYWWVAEARDLWPARPCLWKPMDSAQKVVSCAATNATKIKSITIRFHSVIQSRTA